MQVSPEASQTAEGPAQNTFVGGYQSEEETARQLKVKVGTLRVWGCRGRGPPRTLIGRNVFYRVEALLTWLRQQERDPSANLVA